MAGQDERGESTVGVQARARMFSRRRWPGAGMGRRGLPLAVAGGFVGGLLVGGAVAAHGVPAQAHTAAGAARAQHSATRPGAASASTPAIDQLREQAISTVSPAIVEVQNVGVGLGSGVILSKDGYIVTNNHVVANGHKFVVSLPNGQTMSARVVGTDPVDDLAVVKISAQNLPTATFDNSADLRVGQTVLAIGNPLGIVSTVTDGIVSARRTVPEGNGGGSILNAIQTSAPINPGNSGGGLVDLSGHVVGIPTLAAVDPEFKTPASGIGFAIPSNTVQRITAQLIKYGKVVHSGRAALGISIAPQAVTPQLAQQYNLPVDHGVLIAQLVSNGPAAKAGLKAGDIITKVGNTTITSYDDLLSALATKSPGDKVTVTAATPSGTKTFTVTLGELNVNGNG